MTRSKKNKLKNAPPDVVTIDTKKVAMTDQAQVKVVAQAENTQAVVKPQPKYTTPVRLTHKNPLLTAAGIEASNQINVWHKFILYNVNKTEKEMILDAFILMCAPVFIVPVMYKMETENKATFLAFCRSNTIQKLVNQKLKLKIRSAKVIDYDIVLAFLDHKDMQLHPQKIITELLKHRWNRETTPKKNFLLDNFTNDKHLRSLYCPLHIPFVFDNVLRLARSLVNVGNQRDMKLPVRAFILRNNNMESLVHTEKIFSFNFCKLDLRNNNLLDVSALKPFAEYRITELWLDGNPLCNNYKKPHEYINDVKAIFPNLQMLDGECVSVVRSFVPVFHKHFILQKSKLHLVKQFIEHFFTCYDQDDRIVLNGLYDAGAMFSMTLGPVSNNQHKQLLQGFASNRNLLKFVDYAKCCDYLLCGPEKIINALKLEPSTLHVMKYLDVDMMYSSSNYFMVVVQGPYIYRKSNAPPLWFHRTFVVVEKDDNEFCIANDQYHIDNCPNMDEVDISELEIVTDQCIPSFNPTLFSTSEKHQLLQLLQELTSMNLEYCDRYLKEANWDIRQAIKTFMHSYVDNRVPSEAFRMASK
ncbi:hypothetical protein QAD02_009723 [Eretmocerus hayati]|uniref:Uncharacterized protein n=1 Tax=Eretmocerus hayati TaxID=131215 RepID=A0ACC2NA86_9HYME|nr:hypothetical protein QAD02_009723 [Eretmocerus hayati]